MRRTVPTGISNDAMGSVPQHPFFLRVMDLLQQYDRSWLLPYITVMYSTGPLFLSVIWKEYMQDQPAESGRVRILMQDEYNKYSWSFFTHHTGNSWHGKDAHLIFWVRIHPSFTNGGSNANIGSTDGPTLGVPHFPRIHHRRCRRYLSMVDIRTHRVPGSSISLPLHEGALHH